MGEKDPFRDTDVSETDSRYEPNAVTEIGCKASRDRIREFVHQGETLRIIVVLSGQKQNPVTPLAFDVFMPWPMRELFGDIRGRLHTSVVWNAVARQNNPISTPFAFYPFLNIAGSRKPSRHLPFSRLARCRSGLTILSKFRRRTISDAAPSSLCVSLGSEVEPCCKLSEFFNKFSMW